MAKAAEPKTILAGWCNPQAAEESHERCAGRYQGYPCRCVCHTQRRPTAEEFRGQHIQVDGVPYLVVDAEETPDGGLSLTLGERLS